MANTIDKTTDEALLRSLIDGSITEFEDDTITNFSVTFNGDPNIERIILPNLTSLTAPYVFRNCPSLKVLVLPKLTRFGSYQQIQGNPILKTLILTSLIEMPVNYGIQFNDGLESIVLPSITSLGNDVLRTFNSLKCLDLGENITNLNSRNLCYDSHVFESLILRTPTLVTLSTNVGVLVNTHLKGYGGTYSGHIYVPQLLISEYQNATNWSSMYASYNDLFQPIEGSIYENYYGDGTPIGFSPYGLIGYYAVGESGRYEAIENVPSHINSSVDSDLVAYTATDSNPVHRANDATTSIIPDTYYQGYGKCSCLCVYSSDSFLSENDVITVEYSCAKNASDAYISGNIWGSYKNAMTASTGVTIANGSTFTVSGLSDKMFLHKLIEYHKDGTIKTYINGVLRQTRTVDASNLTNMNWLSLGHSGQSTAYLGPVAIYDRALTSDEIAEHYQFYVDNYMVGQTAYDSSGNFVGA